MKKFIPVLSLMAAIWMTAANADTRLVLTEVEWLAAAKASLALADRREEVTIVVDEGLSPEARNTLERLRKVVSIDELPNQEKIGLPPEAYLRVLQFESKGDRFEFKSTSILRPKNVKTDCGVTVHFFLARTSDGDWKQDGVANLGVCTRHAQTKAG